MTSCYYPLKNEPICRHPYVDRYGIIENENLIEFIYQYVKSAFIEHNDIRTTLIDILGKPTKFPKYGNFPKTFTVKTYGPEVSLSWQDILSWDSIKDTNNYVYVEFHEAVYPIRVSIYEVYNPGFITEIWAQNSDNHWSLLWNGSPQIVPLTSRLFSPPLWKCNFKTKQLRLKFKHNMWNNYTIIDAVMLIGSSELILSKNSEQSLTDLLKRVNYMYSHHEDNLTADYENAHWDISYFEQKFPKYCIINKRSKRWTVKQNNLEQKLKVSQKEIADYKQSFKQKYLYRLLLRSYSNDTMSLSANKSQEQPLSRYNLLSLSDEIILKILKNLNMLMLCRVSQVNKRFNDLSRDPSLYTCLNLRYVCNINTRISDLFYYFKSRCKYLQQLDLTMSNFSVLDFIIFLNNCGKSLTHLRLTGCKSINDIALLNISITCKNLKALDLTFHEHLRGFSHLQSLENLEYLNLTKTVIDYKDLCKVLQKNQRMRELNLENACIEDIDRVLTELRDSCRDLKIINLKGVRNVTSRSIKILDGCKNLRKKYR